MKDVSVKDVEKIKKDWKKYRNGRRRQPWKGGATSSFTFLSVQLVLL